MLPLQDEQQTCTLSSCPQEPTSSSSSSSSSSLSHQRAEEKIYSREDLQALNILDQPVWVFDIVRRAMWFANDAAVELWSAPNLESLLARNFSSDMSDATKNRLDNNLLKFSQKKNGSSTDSDSIQEQWTFYPNGNGPKTVHLTSKGICIEEGRVAMLCQAVYKDQTTEAEHEALRSVEMLRHLPVAVCLTDLEGNIIEQNPEALAVFGSETTNTDTNEESDDDDDDEDEDDDDDDDVVTEKCTVEKKKKKKKKKYSTFIKRFVDKELGYRILEQAKNGKDVISLEALQHTVLGPQYTAVQVRQTKDPVTSEPILLYSARDITAVVDAKRKAVAADVAKMDLLTDMAHAIRTPLQHVVGVVELISRKSTTLPQQPPPNHGDGEEEESKPKRQQQQDLLFPQCNDSRSNLLQSAAQLLMTVIQDLMTSVNSASSSNNGRNDNSFNAGSYGYDRPPKISNRMNRNSTPENLDNTNTTTTTATTTENSRSIRKNRILLEHAQFDIPKVLDNIIATIKPQTRQKNLLLQVKMHKFSKNSTALSVMGDANRLGQVLFELLHNAVKYTSTGSIFVSVRKIQSRSRRVRIRFEVNDSGVGLNLEQQKQCMAQKNSRDSSEGVGLVLCKSIVEAMGGTIGVESKPGRGATFWFEIPFLRASSPTITSKKSFSPSSERSTSMSSNKSDPSNKKSSSSSRKRGAPLDPVPDEGGLHILLVDENSVGRKVTMTLLEQAGHDVTTADNGVDMINAISKGSYDIVLLETQIPQALQALREIRTMGYSAEMLPILALTAAVPRADYPEMGLNDWLTKPIFIKDVQRAMTNALCNVGARSVGTGSVFDGAESTGSSLYGSHVGLDVGDATPSLPRRVSFESIHSAFSDHLQVIMETPSASTNSFPKPKPVAGCSSLQEELGHSSVPVALRGRVA